MLTDASVPGDDALPDTGVGVQRERELAPMFVRGDAYGTRSSTVVLMSKAGEIAVHERTYDSRTREVGRVTHSWMRTGERTSASNAGRSIEA